MNSVNDIDTSYSYRCSPISREGFLAIPVCDLRADLDLLPRRTKNPQNMLAIQDSSAPKNVTLKIGDPPWPQKYNAAIFAAIGDAVEYGRRDNPDRDDIQNCFDHICDFLPDEIIDDNFLDDPEAQNAFHDYISSVFLQLQFPKAFDKPLPPD